MQKNLTTEEFIQKLKIKRTDKGKFYDYSKFIYKNHKTKGIIICPLHGEFEQTPKNHYKNQNCYECYINSKFLTTNEYLEKIKNKRKDKGNYYDYSLVIYKNRKTKIKIICPIHGEFKQLPEDHSNGCGCKSCVGLNTPSTEEFIKKAKKIHGNKYNYSYVNYINSRTDIIITCSIHGNFNQKPNWHLNGYGCKKCSKSYNLTESEFIQRAKLAHNNKYGYSKTIYTNIHNLIIITCPIHGDFNQKAYVHLNGHGCSDCKDSRGEKEIKNWLKNNHIIYIPQNTFPNCKYKRKLKFDFYIPSKNLLIEFDGIQHHFCVDYIINHKLNKEEFDIIQLKDSIKNEYAKNNNTPLLRIPYTEIKNIPQILTNYILK